MNIRTRIAPSPTGQDLHIGNAYTALINYIVAKKYGGQFILRIEDTDRTRFVDGSEKRIIESLSWLGIDHAEGPDKGGPYGPYRQSERLGRYSEYAKELVQNDHAYYCFCSPDRLAQMRENQEARHEAPMYDGHCRGFRTQDVRLRTETEPYVIRLNVPDEGVTSFHDIVRGEISFENRLIDDQVLLKSDGFPTYHLGVVVDDHLMHISHVIRGEEWISSTPKHILLYNFFGWKVPEYAHTPLLRNPDKSKLSKRKNPVWVSWYREQGFLPEAIINYFATLAWSHPDEKIIFSSDEMASAFDLAAIQTTAPVFDIEKLRWMNGEHIRRMQDIRLRTQIYEFFGNKYPLEKIGEVLPLVAERMKTLAEFESLAGFFFERPKEFKQLLDERLVGLVRQALESGDWTHESMEQAIRKKADEVGVKAKDLFMALRVAVTGKAVGPPLLESLELLGKEETLARLSR